jgi:HEAT repeat protein
MLRLPGININWFSLLLGLVGAALLFVIIVGLARISRQSKETQKSKKAEESKTKILSVKTRYFEQLLLWCQHQHIADELFPLSDILIEPHFTSPPPSVDPENTFIFERMIDKIIPFNPVAMEVISQYNINKITFPQAIANGVDLAIVGKMGSGKTTALIYLLLKVITGKIPTPEIINRIPIYAHVHELQLSISEGNSPLGNIIQKIVDNFPGKNQEEAKYYFDSQLEESRILLLLDGMDELSSTDYSLAIKKLIQIKQKYPKILIITAIRPEQTYYISQMGFQPLFITTWDSTTVDAFLEKWEKVWNISAFLAGKQTKIDEIPSEILDSWISKDRKLLSPLDWTLLIWGVKSNDIQSFDLPMLIESYIHRKIKDEKWLKSLRDVASGMIQEGDTILSAAYMDKLGKSGISIDTLIKSRILIPVSANEFRFVHPIILAYLSQKSTTSPENDTLSPLDISFYQQYLGVVVPPITKPIEYIQATISGIVDAQFSFIQILDRFAKLSYIKLTPREIAPLISIVKLEMMPVGIRLAMLSILQSAFHPSISELTTLLLSSDSPTARSITAIHLGSEGDRSAEKTLLDLLSDPVPDVRGAACFALMKMGSATGLQAVVDQLLEGNEELKRYAAEALTNDPIQGYEILKQTVHSPAISIRRASVQGLACIPEDWVIELLTQLSVEDDQWIIRDMAVQMLEFRQKSNPYIPRHIPLAADASWLIQMASAKGIGISRGDTPYEVLFEVLSNGSLEEQLAAMDYLGDASRKETLEQLKKKARGPENMAREKAAYLLWLNSLRNTR